MVSKRNFFNIMIMMATLLFLFQFSMVIRAQSSSYDHNNAVSENPLSGQDAWQQAKMKLSALTEEDDPYVLFVGDAAGGMGQAVSSWCTYRKKNIIVTKSMTELTDYVKLMPEMIVLESESYALEGASLKKLEKLEKEDFDILLTDVKMPFMDGIELIDHVVKEKKKLRTVIFSGCNEFDYAKKAIRLGVVDYILKPVDPNEFKNTLNKVVNELEEAKASDELKNKSMEFLYEHALYMLLNGTDVTKLRQEYSGLSLDLGKFKNMLLMEFNHDFFGRRGVDFKENENLKSIGILQYLNLNQQQEILFLGDEMNILRKANEIVKIIKADYDADCYIAISSDIGDLSEVADKMEELEVLMENKFYHPEIHVFYPNMEGETPGIIQFDDDTFMKQMKQDIKMKNVEALREHFQRFCEKYRHKTEYSQIYIKFLFSNLMKDVYGSIDETDEAELNKDIEKLYMATDFQVLTELVEEAIRRLETCFAGKTQMAHREVELVKQYIYRNYGSELGIDMLADMVHLAPSYLSTVFKKETGQNLSKFIKAYRMEQAKDMLENSMTKIVDISVACGYPNVSYFCSSFREFFGVSPQKFRESGGQADA